MNKLIVLAALAAASFVVPTLPVQAQPVMPAVSENCMVLPMLKQACWEEARAAWEAGPPAIEMAAVTLPAPPAPPAMPMPPTCTRAAAGSGYLLDCQ